MPAVWPSFLQDKLNEAGFSYDFGDTTIRSEVDGGPPKVRSRYTNAIDEVSCSITLDYDDYVDFRLFFDVDLNRGATSFTFNHPLTGDPTEFRFKGRPRITPLGGRVFTVSMTWEKIFG